MTGNEKDRYVTAVAVQGAEHREPWRVVALHPQSFQIRIFRQEGCLTVLGEGGMIGMICEEIHKRS